MFRSPVLPEIQTLDAVRDHQRIVFLCCRLDFPWDTTRALEFALFRTFCVPAISALLDKTQDFGKRAQKRYDDTDIIVSEMMEDATSRWPLDFRSHRLSCGARWNCP